MLKFLPRLATQGEGSELVDWDNLYQVSVANFTTTSLSAVNITGLSAPVVASSKYEVEAVLAFQSDNGNGLQFGWAFSAAGATGEALGIFMTTSAAAVINGAALGTIFPLNIAGTSGATTMTCFIKAVLVTGVNAGYLNIQVLKITNGTATVYIGSILKIKKLA
jgi:hypothetical protein